MGLFDSILGVLNPDVIAIYKNLVNNHSEAFHRWKGKQIVGTLSRFFDFEPTYNDKSYIASHESEILAFEAIIAEEKAYAKRRQEVIKAASDYPHAFVALLKKLSIPSIPGISATLPGQRKSKRSQRIEKEHINSSPYNRVLSPYIAFLQRGEDYSWVNRSSRTINSLSKEEYEELYSKLNTLASEESRIKKELQKEDMLIRFDDEVLDNVSRAKFYQDFCKSKSISDTDEKKKIYCVEHLSELDTFGNSEIVIACGKLRHKYPSGFKAFEDAHRSMTKLQIIDHEDEIKTYEDNFQQVNIQNEWENDQETFTQESRDLRDSILSSYGCYIYNVPFQKLTYTGKDVSGTYRVWQLFCVSFCDAEDIEYTYYRDIYENYKKIDEFKAKTRYFYDRVYDKIIEFIEALKQKHDNIVVTIADSSLGDNSVDFNNYHFAHFKQSLAEKKIKIFSVDELIQESIAYSYVVVVELISTNEGLISTCKRLIDTYKKACPKITYVSLYKGFSKFEMTELINKEKQKKEAEERVKREEAERKERERLEIFRKEEECRRLKAILQSAVQSWDSICGVIKYSYLINYYPTTCDFEATEREWANRWLVWNFKNTPGKTSSSDHKEALENVVPRLKKKLIDTFGLQNLKKLVLVCIPASSQQKTALRYQDFSRMLCAETGLISAYDKMTVTGERTPKHLGGTSASMDGIEFDRDFFKDKFVILFDDIVTKGNSMLSFKRKMENLGATVICALSIGKTKH